MWPPWRLLGRDDRSQGARLLADGRASCGFSDLTLSGRRKSSGRLISPGSHGASARRNGFDSIVELFGEQTVQVMTALLQSAMLLAVAMVLVLLSVRRTSWGLVPAGVGASHVTRLSPMDGMRPSDQVLLSCQSARAPPDPLQSPGVPIPAAMSPVRPPGSARR